MRLTDDVNTGKYSTLLGVLRSGKLRTVVGEDHHLVPVDPFLVLTGAFFVGTIRPRFPVLPCFHPFVEGFDVPVFLVCEGVWFGHVYTSF